MRGLSRRTFLRGAALTLAGGATGAVGAVQVPRWCGWDQPPISGGYASADDNQNVISKPAVTVHYHVDTTDRVVALTFDDGPAPQWTPMFLDALEAAGVPGTFFMVGQQVERHWRLVHNRLAGHEVGNHSWAHRDLATMDYAAVRADLSRTAATIADRLGHPPKYFRPPYGHVGGSTLLAADSLGYDVMLWNCAMHELQFHDDPSAQADDLVRTVRPGSIILAHDSGDNRRLVGLHSLPAMVAGLKAKGYRFTTLSGLLAATGQPDRDASVR